MHAERKRVLILCKTYPSPSSRHVETSCVAGVDEAGKLIRLFPVPFRLISDEQQFKKWQWIEARIRKATDDHRPESHRISVDTIETLGDPLVTQQDWLARRLAIQSVPVFDDFMAMEDHRVANGSSLAILRPLKLNHLRISAASEPDWTDEEVAKLMQAQSQGDLFDQSSERQQLKLLKKLPYDFHYEYTCQTTAGPTTYAHKLVDWEAGGLYWKIHRRADWQEAFRQRFFDDFLSRDLLFLMGTIHRFPKQWLIVSVLYFPRQQAERIGQGTLFDL